MRKKIIILIFLIVCIVLLSGITYSVLTSGSTLSTNQDIAKFIFDAQKIDHIDLPLYDLKPGDVKEYKFSVSNNREENNLNISSDVTIVYNIIVNTYHFMPLKIELYNEDDNQTPIMICDESYSRNEDRELICKSEAQYMSYSTNVKDNYILRLTFEEQYNSFEYSNLIDYIDLEIESYQKVVNNEEEN